MIEIFYRKISIADVKDVWNEFYVVGVERCPLSVSAPKMFIFDYVQTSV